MSPIYLELLSLILVYFILGGGFNVPFDGFLRRW